MSSAPHTTRAWKYARRIVKGEILANKWIKLACRWMLDDQKASKLKSFPWLFDREAAEEVLRMMQEFPHVKGEWASRGEKIHLEDWQCFHWAMVFGWLNRKTGFRRFNQTLLFVARKNAKTTVAATIGNLMLTHDGEYGAEIYSGATTEKQAKEVFGAAQEMARKNDDFRDHFGVQVNASNMSVLATNSKFEPLIGKPGEGASPHCAIHDEYHEHPTDEQLETMKTGMGSRRQPLQIVITTAGDNTTGPCAQMCDDARKNLEGSLRNDRFFPLLYCADEGDSWDSIAAMKKANPNLGVSVHRDFLNQQLEEARPSAAKQVSYKTKHLNEWVGSRSAYFNIERWKQAADAKLRMSDFSEFPLVLGLDLATKIDIAALIALFLLGDDQYAMFAKFYLPEATVDAGDNKNYKGWVDQGRLIDTPGDMTDFKFIKKDILDLHDQFNVREVAFDPWQEKMLITDLQDEGVTCVELRQTVKNLSDSMKTMDGLVRSKNIAHDGCPVYTWMLSNVTAKIDANGNVFPRKEREENKIDGPVATMTALARATMGDLAGGPSVYEDRGLITV